MPNTKPTYHELLEKLNAREYKFVAEYLVSGNAAKAARTAGYSDSSPHTSQQIGHENMMKPDVFAAIQAGLDMIAARCEVSAEKIIRELAAVAFSSAHHYEAGSDGALVVAEGAPEEAGLALQVKHRRVTKADGSTETETTYLQLDKLKALELLGKKLKLWTERLEVEDAQDELYRQLLASLKERKT